MHTSINLLAKIAVVCLLALAANGATLSQRELSRQDEISDWNFDLLHFPDSAVHDKQLADLTDFVEKRKSKNAALFENELREDSTTDGPGDLTDSGSTDYDGSTDYTDAPDGETTTDSNPPEPSNELSGGAIAGIVIGSIAGVALVAGGVYYLYVKKKLCFE